MTDVNLIGSLNFRARDRRLSGSSVRAPRGAAVAGLPDFIAPQLCKLVDRPPVRGVWGHEVKFDGYRLQLRVERGQALLRTRKGLDWTHRFGALALDAISLPDCIVDGEVVALDHRGMPSFSGLQSALSGGNTDQLIYFAFDLLFVNREDLRELGLMYRKLLLERMLLARYQGERIRFVEHFAIGSDQILKAARKLALEGIVSKRLDAPYVSGGSDTWVKSKCRPGHEVVIGGYTTQAGGVRSLLVGVNHGGKLVYVGRVGTGFSRTFVKDLWPKLQTLTTEASPFGGDNPPSNEVNVHWVKPKLVAEIAFASWSVDGMLRQASFKGMRLDKRAAEIVSDLPSFPSTDPDAALAWLAQQPRRGPRNARPMRAGRKH